MNTTKLATGDNVRHNDTSRVGRITGDVRENGSKKFKVTWKSGLMSNCSADALSKVAA
jgi:hypothetical protein